MVWKPCQSGSLIGIFNLCHLHFVVIFLFSPPPSWCTFFLKQNKTKQNIPEWIQCNIRIKQWLSFTRHEVKSTDPGSFLPMHTLWMCCKHSWVFMWKGQRLHVVKKVVNQNFKIPPEVVIGDLQRAAFKGTLLPLNTWFGCLSRDRSGNCGKNWKSLSSTARAECYWFPLFCSGSVVSCFLSPRFKRFMPSQWHDCTSGNNTNSNPGPPEADVGNNLFPTSPMGQGRENSQPLHQLSQFKSSKVNWRKQMVPFATEQELQADNRKH